MTFANPWGLLALLAVPAIVVIHLYHRRFPPLLVAGLHLWSSQTLQPLAGRTRERLPISTSLILELLAALVLSVVLAQPRFGELDRVVHLVAILDSTASMSARAPGKPSFRDTAVAELERRLAAAPRGSVITILLTGTRTESLGHALPWDEAREKLKDWQPLSPLHSFDSAFDAAEQMADKSGQILFLTDKTIPDKDLSDAMEVVALGEPLENVAISSARWTFDRASGSGKVFVRVQNHGVNRAAGKVRGFAGQRRLFEETLALAPHAGAGFEAAIPGGIQELTVQVEVPGDGLDLDSKVQLVEPHARLVTVANTLPKDHAAREKLQKVLGALPDVQAGSAATADLVFATAMPLPESNARLWWLGLGPLSTAEADLKQSKTLKGPYLLEKKHPLLEGVELEGVIWGGVQPLPFDTAPLVSAGLNRLLSALNGTRTTGYVMNIDVAESNLTESPDWPIILSNLVESRRTHLPGLQRWNYRLGEEVSFRLFEGDDAHQGQALTVHSGDKTKPLARSAFIEIAAPDRPGVYVIRDGEEVFDRFAVNFHDDEVSNLRSLNSGRRVPKVDVQTPRLQTDSRYTWIVLAGLALILAAVITDWFVLQRAFRATTSGRNRNAS